MGRNGKSRIKMDDQPLYESRHIFRNLWQRYRVYTDRIERQFLLGKKIVRVDDIVDMEVRAVPVIGDLFRGKGLASSLALELDFSDLFRRVAIHRRLGWIKHIRIAPDDPEEFLRVCRLIALAASSAQFWAQAIPNGDTFADAVEAVHPAGEGPHLGDAGSIRRDRGRPGREKMILGVVSAESRRSLTPMAFRGRREVMAGEWAMRKALARVADGAPPIGWRITRTMPRAYRANTITLVVWTIQFWTHYLAVWPPCMRRIETVDVIFERRTYVRCTVPRRWVVHEYGLPNGRGR